MNAPSSEVIRFMTDKYINKKWVDKKMKRHPVQLLEERPNKFNKWKKMLLSGNVESAEEEVKKPSKKQPTKSYSNN